jgi:hypothetical protein
MLLPETFQIPLPECLEDVSSRKINKFLSWKVWIKEDQDKQHLNDKA